jgi:hypothetical protein
LSSPPLLELSSSLPEELSESEELLPLLLLICSMMSTSALSSAKHDKPWSAQQVLSWQSTEACVSSWLAKPTAIRNDL